MARSLPNTPVKSQHARFVETAKALECDDDEARFKEKQGKIAKAKVSEPKPTK